MKFLLILVVAFALDSALAVRSFRGSARGSEALELSPIDSPELILLDETTGKLKAGGKCYNKPNCCRVSGCALVKKNVCLPTRTLKRGQINLCKTSTNTAENPTETKEDESDEKTDLSSTVEKGIKDSYQKGQNVADTKKALEKGITDSYQKAKKQKCKDVANNDHKCCSIQGCAQKKEQDGKVLKCVKKSFLKTFIDQCPSENDKLEKKCKSIADDDQTCCSTAGCAQKENNENLECHPDTLPRTWIDKCPDKVQEKCKSVADDDEKCCSTAGCGQKEEKGVLKCVKKPTFGNKCPEDKAEINKFDGELAGASAEPSPGSDRIGTAVAGEVVSPWGSPSGSSSKSARVSEGKPFPNIGYLGSGYDITEGNPEGDTKSLLDPGYRAPIIQLSFEKTAKHTTADRKYLVPTQSYAIGRVACQHATTANKMSSMNDYTDSVQDDVSQDISASAGYSGVGVSVSAGIQSCNSKAKQEFAQNVATTNTDRFEMKSYCVQHRVVLDSPFNTLTLADHFIKGLAKLPRWNVVNVDDCAKQTCSNLYFSEINLYLAVRKDSSLVLQKKSPEGTWLFGDDKLLFWLTGDNGKWEVDDSTKVLTRVGEGKATKLALKPRDSKNIKSAQWRYTDNANILVYDVDKKGKGLAIGWDESERKKKKNKDTGTPVVVGAGDAAKVVKGYYDVKDMRPWKVFFKEYGTHFINSMDMGGRMTTIVTMSSSDVKKVEETGVKAAWAVAASVSGEGYGVKAEGSYKKTGTRAEQSKAMESLQSAKRETKTFVLGGDPPAGGSAELSQAAFSAWAATVPEKPMPVKLQLSSIVETGPFQCDLLETPTVDVNSEVGVKIAEVGVAEKKETKKKAKKASGVSASKSKKKETEKKAKKTLKVSASKSKFKEQRFSSKGTGDGPDKKQETEKKAKKTSEVSASKSKKQETEKKAKKASEVSASKSKKQETEKKAKKASEVSASKSKKKETKKKKKTAGDTKKKSAFTEAQKKDCRDLRATFLHAYTKYATGALRAFNDKLNAMQRDHDYGGHSDTEKYGNMLTTRGGEPVCLEPDYPCGTKIRSKNSRYTLELACDGNLVLLNKLGQIKWQTGTQCKKDGGKVWAKLKFQALEIYCDRDVIWSTYSELEAVSGDIYIEKKGTFASGNAMFPKSDSFVGGLGLKFLCGGSTHFFAMDPGFTDFKVEDDGNLRLVGHKKHDAKDKFKAVERLLWQSGSGADKKGLPDYDGYKPEYGYQMCPKSQKRMPLISKCEGKKVISSSYRWFSVAKYKPLVLKNDPEYPFGRHTKDLFGVFTNIRCAQPNSKLYDVDIPVK